MDIITTVAASLKVVFTFTSGRKHLIAGGGSPEYITADGIELKRVINADGKFEELFLSFIPECDETLLKAEVYLDCVGEIRDFIPYDTFRNASGAAFVRFESSGFFCGFANPFCTYTSNGNTVCASFEPAMKLYKGRRFDFEPFFIGLTTLFGGLNEQVMPSTTLNCGGVNRARYFNPSGHIPLYNGETESFAGYVEHYLQPDINKYRFIFYTYFNPLPQQPKTTEDEQLYYRYIDNFVAMGGDTIIFNPLQRQKTPTSDMDSYWEIYESGSVAERILKYAQEKGLDCGVYMGSAQANTKYCNSSSNEFVSSWEGFQWKKTGKCGELSRENCIADDSFCDWFIQTQINTVKKYGLKVWNWDPGPGNAFFCYSSRHGHIPGKGGYKGFRNCVKVVESIKKAQPGIFLMAFHGVKEYGVWGLKYFDQHEAFWEQAPAFFATQYPDLSAERITADGMRLQSIWNHKFRFLPYSINHSICSKMLQDCNSPQFMRDMFDYAGYRFSLISAVAAGKSITITGMPVDVQECDDGKYIKFYKKWIGFAKEHFGCNYKIVTFGTQVERGGFDGWSHINGNKGYIFLFNSSPFAVCADFTMSEAGWNGSLPYTFRMLEPSDGEVSFGAEKDGAVKFSLSPFGVYVFEVEARESQSCSDVAAAGESEFFRYFDTWTDGKGNVISSFPCNGRVNGRYTATPAMHKLIEEHKKTFPSGLADEIENFRRMTGDSFPWAFPGMILFVALFDRVDDITSVKCVHNGKRFDMKAMSFVDMSFCNRRANAYYAELDNIIYGGENEISVLSDRDDFIGGYLHYPDSGFEYIVPKSVPKYCGERKILKAGNFKINNAWIKEGYFKEYSTVTLLVDAGMPPEKLKGVFTTCPVNIEFYSMGSLTADRELKYDNFDGLWKAEFKVGARNLLIIDDWYLNIFAVDTDDRVSRNFKLKIDWILS